DTLNISGSFTSANNNQLENIENIAMSGGAATLNLSNQTESINIAGSTGADTIYASSGGGTVTAGTGADRINISAGTSTTNWSVNLGSDATTDKIVFSHAVIGDGHNTVATVSGFTVTD